MKTVRIDLFSDINCPWCFIGTRRLAQVADSLSDELEIEVHHHPYRLMPEATVEGVHLPTVLRERYGQDPRPMFARVEAAAQDAGIDLDLSKQEFAYDTIAAHTLLRHAGPKGTQAALNDALFVAYFQEARNVGSANVLVEIATAHGFEEDEARALLNNEAELEITRREAQEATRQGIQGVPFFILDNRLALSGAQPEEVFKSALRKAATEAEAPVS